MNCVYCGKECNYPDDFPVSYLAKCVHCHIEEEKIKQKKSKGLLVILAIISSILLIATVSALFGNIGLVGILAIIGILYKLT